MERFNRYQTGSMLPMAINMVISRAEFKKKNPGKEIVIAKEDFPVELSTLYDAMRPTIGFEKVYYLTEKTMKRINHMDISSFLGPNNPALGMVFKEDECAYLVFHANGKEFGLCDAVYCIKDSKIYAKVYTDQYVAGYIVPDSTDGDKIAIVPYSAFSMCEMQRFPDEEIMNESINTQLAIMKSDFPEGTFPNDLRRVAKRKNFASMKTHDMIEDHLMYQAIIADALKAIIFLKTAEVYSQEYTPDRTPTYRRKKGYMPLGYTIVDTTWDMNIDVNNPFPVRGHFKMQAYKKDGEWDHKLIYVEPYMKTGYHRRAQKLIDNGK